MPVYILEPICDEAVQALSARHEIVNFPASREGDWREHAQAIVVRMYKITEEDLVRAQQLRIIAKHGTGVDNIDVAAAKRRGVLVTNTPGANARAVAEYVVTLALALARRVTQADRDIRCGVWKQAADAFELEGKVVGVVGLGDVGGRAAAMLRQGFGCSILAYDPFAKPEALAQVGATAVASLDELLSQADIVSLHVPLTEQTRNMIGDAELARMKPSSVLINVARGGIVDEEALHCALTSGQIAAAACDVFECEPVLADHPLLGLDNFIASAHAAGSSRESMRRMGLTAVENVIAALDGRHPPHAL